MTSSKEMVLIGGVAQALSERGSWTGETHIQKTAYIAKTKKLVPFESDFVLYKHGPFSFDLSKSIVHMLSRGLLSSETNPGYGPSLRLTFPLWHALDLRLGDYFSQYRSAIVSVSDRLAKKNVAELERVATAVFVTSQYPQASVEELSDMITRLKPHISRELANRALSESNEL